MMLSEPILVGQETRTNLSLSDCVQTAVENNINMEKARLEKTKSRYKVAENRSYLLPQISIEGNFQDNLKMPVTMIPGDFLGQPGDFVPLTMGVQYNTSASVAVNQILYDQTKLTRLKLSKKADMLNELSIEKAKENLTQEVAKLYFLSQTTAEHKQIIEENIVRLERMTNITKIQLNNGIGKQVDYDRVSVALENLRTKLGNTDALHQQQLNMIKYLLEMPSDKMIVLTDTVNYPLLSNEPITISDFSDHIDIQVLEKQKEIADLNQKVIKNEYLPTVSFTGQFAYQGARDNFKDYFNSSPTNKSKSKGQITSSLH